MYFIVCGKLRCVGVIYEFFIQWYYTLTMIHKCYITVLFLKIKLEYIVIKKGKLLKILRIKYITINYNDYKIL